MIEFKGINPIFKCSENLNIEGQASLHNIFRLKGIIVSYIELIERQIDVINSIPFHNYSQYLSLSDEYYKLGLSEKINVLRSVFKIINYVKPIFLTESGTNDFFDCLEAIVNLRNIITHSVIMFYSQDCIELSNKTTSIKANILYFSGGNKINLEKQPATKEDIPLTKLIKSKHGGDNQAAFIDTIDELLTWLQNFQESITDIFTALNNLKTEDGELWVNNL